MATTVTVFSGDNRIVHRSHDTRELAEKDAASWRSLSPHLVVTVEDDEEWTALYETYYDRKGS